MVIKDPKGSIWFLMPSSQAVNFPSAVRSSEYYSPVVKPRGTSETMVYLRIVRAFRIKCRAQKHTNGCANS